MSLLGAPQVYPSLSNTQAVPYSAFLKQCWINCIFYCKAQGLGQDTATEKVPEKEGVKPRGMSEKACCQGYQRSGGIVFNVSHT